MKIKKITEKELIEATKKFNETEKKGSFYDLAINLHEKGLEIEAYLFLLATWNAARFRYVKNTFDILEFKRKVAELDPNFGKLKNENLKHIDFNKYSNDIREIYNVLSNIKGIEYTGASKIMHLKNREVFVMWDQYIKGSKYGKDADGYISFLKDMQNMISNVNIGKRSNIFVNKTLAKLIDEFNMVNITMPILKKKNSKKKEKEEKNKRLLNAFEKARGIWENYDEIDAIRKETKERWQEWQKELEKYA